MSASRTDKPTPRRLREARLRGEVAVSRELVAGAALAAGGLALAASGAWGLAALAGGLRAGLLAAVAPEPSPGPAVAAAGTLLLRTGAVPLLAALLGGATAGLLSTRLFAPGLAAPAWRRVDPAAGLRRLLSPRSLVAAGLGLARAALILLVAWLVVRPGLAALGGLAGLGPAALARALGGLLLPLAMALAGLLAAHGLLDLALARRRLARSLRMTRDEVRREQREDAGDPAVRAERRRTHQALAGAGPVAGAAVLVVNPTRLAVALGHRRGGEDPPVVLAKGTGARAARLRREARRAGVPVIRDVALARSLFRLAEVGEAIPEELYQAAAAVLLRVYGRGASP